MPNNLNPETFFKGVCERLPESDPSIEKLTKLFRSEALQSRKLFPFTGANAEAGKKIRIPKDITEKEHQKPKDLALGTPIVVSRTWLVS